MAHEDTIIHAIDTSPLNRGLRGADWVVTPGNIAIVNDDGDVALFDAEGDAIYQVHFLFNSRGKKAIAHAKDAFRQMFEDHAANMIFGMTPSSMPHALIHARLVGGKHIGTRITPHGACELFVLSREMWKRDNTK